MKKNKNAQPGNCAQLNQNQEIRRKDSDNYLRMQALKRLKQLHFDEHYRQHPGIPEGARYYRKFDDCSANGLTNCIITWLKLNGHQAERISNTGRPVDKTKEFVDAAGFRRRIGRVEWVYGTGTPGTADISVTIYGLSVKIEVKLGRDKQSEAQKEYQRAVEKSGGVYIIAKTFSGFLEWYDNFIVQKGGSYESL